MSGQDDRLQEVKHWEPLFPEEMVKEAKTAKVQNQITSFHYYSWRTSAQMVIPRIAKSGNRYRQYFSIEIDDYPERYTENWKLSSFRCDCPEGRREEPCIHEAAVLVRLEKEHGPFIGVETAREYQMRKDEEKRAQEKQRLKALREKLGQTPVSAMKFFGHRTSQPGLVIWDFASVLRGYHTTAYEIERTKELKRDNLFSVSIHEQTSREGIRQMSAQISTADLLGDGSTAAYAAITGTDFDLHEFSNRADLEYQDNETDRVQIEYRKKNHILNAPELLMIEAMWNYADQAASEHGDMTDEKALTFFSLLNTPPKKAARTETQEEHGREKAVLLLPRIIIEEGQAKLGFKIGKTGGRMMVLKNLRELVSCEADETQLTLSRTETIDFGKAEFTDSARPLYEFISRRVGEIADANEKIERRNSFRSVRTLSVSSQLELKGALLDNFYDVADGQECEYTDKTNNIKDARLKVGYQPLHFSLEADRLSDARDTFAGVEVHGLVPVLLRGRTHQYVLNSAYLSRVKKEELDTLAPFRKVADDSGYFRFQVGRDHLQEFYYRVVPRLLESPCVYLKDNTEEEAREYLPPEPVFTFFVDTHHFGEEPEDAQLGEAQKEKGRKASEADRYVLTLRGTIEYGEKKYTLGDPPQQDQYHDTEQEKRVEQAVGLFFRTHHENAHNYSSIVTDAEMVQFLQDGLATLEEYGTVKGSEAFRRLKMRPVPQIRLGISVSSGIMDLTLTSAELSQKELLEIYSSYRHKKRWHRLSSGDYVDLTDDTQIRELDDLMTGMDLSAEDVIKKTVSLPVYRALYLDRLLEKHEEITSSRDRVYRALIRNFKTVKDAEMEPPATLENTLRPYQNYGYKWLMTLTGAGFGGILADEMGLGKTLQMIAVLLAFRENDPNHKAAPSLIVCPASLVYNWQEEFARFAPELVVRPLSGGAAQRRQALEAFDQTDAYIISYDLLKRHVAKLEPLSFSFLVLDEAQYIKNAGAAAAKSVKVLHADHRFALTGTPIENRLSELWSIFDFLMPGFLYSHKDFEQKFEVPITKTKDPEAIGKLSQMTAPFILRRRKEEVLKDLPPKLEEVRYVQLSGEQQKLYDAQVVRIKQTAGTEDHEKIRILAELTRIREICCDPSLVFEDYHGESVKRAACLDLIESAMDGGHRMLVFSQFTSMLALLEADLKEAGIPYYLLTGATSKEKRIQMVHAFNEGDTPVFLISLKAGGTGLNLTGADVVIHYDPWWNLAAQNQATDRTHRIGQTKQVTVYKMIIKNTIEERIMELQETKKDLAESVIEGRSNPLAALSREELLALL